MVEQRPRVLSRDSYKQSRGSLGLCTDDSRWEDLWPQASKPRLDQKELRHGQMGSTTRQLPLRKCETNCGEERRQPGPVPAHPFLTSNQAIKACVLFSGNSLVTPAGHLSRAPFLLWIGEAREDNGEFSQEAGTVPRDRQEGTPPTVANPTHKPQRSTTLLPSMDHRRKQHFAAMYIYIHIEKPTNYIMCICIYIYIYVESGRWDRRPALSHNSKN